MGSRFWPPLPASGWRATKQRRAWLAANYLFRFVVRFLVAFAADFLTAVTALRATDFVFLVAVRTLAVAFFISFREERALVAGFLLRVFPATPPTIAPTAVPR